LLRPLLLLRSSTSGSGSSGLCHLASCSDSALRCRRLSGNCGGSCVRITLVGIEVSAWCVCVCV
jgi:hypothetical protein